MCFSTRCLTTGSTGVSVTRRTKFLKSFFLSRVSMGKVLEKITIVSKKFDIYMVSRFDWSILILFFSLVGTYASIGVKVSHRVEIMYFFHIFNFCEIRYGVGAMIGEHTSIWMTPSLLSHHALETVECDESNEGETIFGRGGAGNSFTMSHTATRGSSWPYMDFKFVCDVSSGEWDYALIWHMGGVYLYMGTPQRHRFIGRLKCPLPYYYQDSFLFLIL